MKDGFVPMKGEDVKRVEDLRFPLYASRKYDGIRGELLANGHLVSYKMIRIPNEHARRFFELPVLRGLEGELIAGDPAAPGCMQRTTSAVMSDDLRDAELRLYVFDSFLLAHLPYAARYEALRKASRKWPENVILVEQVPLASWHEAAVIEKQFVEEGYEGVMFRDPSALYKFGRSSLKQQALLKWKRFCDSEAEIEGYEEGEANNNVAMRDAHGRSKRSGAAAGKVPNGTLGRLLVRDVKTGVAFNIGSGKGLTLKLRAEMWANRERLKGLIVKYRYQPVGVKEKPRFPRFIGFRDRRDM